MRPFTFEHVRPFYCLSPQFVCSTQAIVAFFLFLPLPLPLPSSSSSSFRLPRRLCNRRLLRSTPTPIPTPFPLPTPSSNQRCSDHKSRKHPSTIGRRNRPSSLPLMVSMHDFLLLVCGVPAFVHSPFVLAAYSELLWSGSVLCRHTITGLLVCLRANRLWKIAHNFWTRRYVGHSVTFAGCFDLCIGGLCARHLE